MSQCPLAVFVDDGWPYGQCLRRAGHDGICDPWALIPSIDCDRGDEHVDAPPHPALRWFQERLPARLTAGARVIIWHTRVRISAETYDNDEDGS